MRSVIIVGGMICVLLGILIFVTGCPLMPVSEEVAQAQKDIATLKAQASTMPAGRARDEVIKTLDKAESKLGEIEAYLGFAVGVGGIALGIWQRFKKGQMEGHLENVVNSIDTVMPPSDPDTKLKLAALQGPETSKVVNEIKNGKKE